MGYTDNYNRDIYGILDFWVRNSYDHSTYLDREISHHELELAKANQHATQRMGNILKKIVAKSPDVGALIVEAQQSVHEYHGIVTYTMDKSLHCDIIVSTPVSLLDHMVREAEESQRIFKLLQSGGGQYTPSDASIHESTFWLRQMADHLVYIQHYLDGSNYDLRYQVIEMTHKFERLLLQAQALKTMIRRPRNETLPILTQFNKTIIKEAKELEKFKLELDNLIKECAAVTTSPPGLLEHIAREAHHLWRNLEDGIIT
ncbi:DUF2935 domain-containing protein [Schinkia azotoformans]|uniref:DUF2935 domain-containing protein n=1 Tax=Schinkia azotoformans TaxID=1454 RepID=UPI002DB65253|nr:DUF2935 domain-containing protein [Schinkia azotoformans]MEC1781820.1 DUF2935 domain-containing protein [Schinkia azotoformans]MED4331501.1 DUF2935 domain-containing protein [Schinkia azotoformans]